ncbi:hypothetical protein [Atlantibacter hermannii]|uniref:hypothetical protein n=1 Tax=Atlantibacter hermannii TaxID=565 RepID=UPI0028A09EEB|nr:hypothetical protein [Atlantibacter hermannii]
MSDNTPGKLDTLKDKLRFPRKKAKDSEMESNEPEPVQAADGTAIPPADNSANGNPALAKYRQMLERIVIDGLLNIAEEKLSDTELVESVLKKAYELLPAPVRLVVSRDWCLRYLHARKEPLLAQLRQYQAARAEGLSPPTPEAEKVMQPVPDTVPLVHNTPPH